jgi:predicted nucleic acid-binding protein
MIAIDACVVISFLQGETNDAVERFAALLSADQAVLAPSTVAELLSDPKGGADTVTLIEGLKTLPLEPDYWRRAGLLRAAVRRLGGKAALGDALAAQSCLDANVPLLTSDSDFRAFVEVSDLKLAA